MKELIENHIFPMVFIVVILIFFFVVSAKALDRCQDYVTDIRIQHWKYFGVSYPYWYGVGQARQESACRANVTAFDAGMGLTQFMPRTWREVEVDMGVKLNPYNTEHSIKAQAFYIYQLHKQNSFDGTPLFATYQSYNGGWGLLKKEAARAGITCWCHMREQCKRKVLKLKSGRLLDLCDVNYDYSMKVHKYGQRYKILTDAWRFW